MKIAICHDFFDKSIGGGETEMKMLAEGLAREHDITLYTGFFNKTTGFKIDVPIKELGMINKGPMKQLEIAWRFSRLNLDKYDAVISENYWSVFARHKNHIHHVEAPLRQFYDMRGLWTLRLPLWQRLPFNMLIDALIPFEQMAIKRCRLVANSEFTKTRIQMYYGRDSVVIYPPVVSKNYKYEKNGDYWLYVGRIDYNKRIDFMIEVFKKAKKKLIIVGTGPEQKKLEKKLVGCKEDIYYYGYVNDKRLIDLYSKCMAVFYMPTFEDFGQVPVEAMASGKPVLGSKEGGLLETVIDGKTGWLLHPREDEVVDLIKYMTPEECGLMKDACIERALDFDIEKYLESWEEIL